MRSLPAVASTVLLVHKIVARCDNCSQGISYWVAGFARNGPESRRCWRRHRTDQSDRTDPSDTLDPAPAIL